MTGGSGIWISFSVTLGPVRFLYLLLSWNATRYFSAIGHVMILHNSLNLIPVSNFENSTVQGFFFVCLFLRKRCFCFIFVFISIVFETLGYLKKFMKKRFVFCFLIYGKDWIFFSVIIFYKSFFMEVFFFILLGINPTKGHDKTYSSTHYQGINQVGADGTVLVSRRTRR